MRCGGYRYPIYWHYIGAEGSNILVALRLQMKAVKVRYRHSVVNLYGIFSCPYLRLGLVRFQPPKAQEIRDMDKAHAMQRTHQQELLRMREHKARIDTEREKEIERRLEGGMMRLSLVLFVLNHSSKTLKITRPVANIRKLLKILMRPWPSNPITYHLMIEHESFNNS